MTWVRSLGREDPLEEGMATHSSILAWRILWTEGPGGLPSMGSQESRTRLSKQTTFGHLLPENRTPLPALLTALDIKAPVVSARKPSSNDPWSASRFML